uniref:Uncharacterized protein n=1 Tax=Tanacetum cinerariifolium TaxID=118510 RepID=A0A6L2KRS8_TANCI|nr:hypothetical protein [Tanacetum cinerariifolium]
MFEEEKARKHEKVFNGKTAKYGKIWYDEDVHDLRSVETEFPAIVCNDNLTSNETLSCEPTTPKLVPVSEAEPPFIIRLRVQHVTSAGEAHEKKVNVLATELVYLFQYEFSSSMKYSLLSSRNASSRMTRFYQINIPSGSKRESARAKAPIFRLCVKMPSWGPIKQLSKDTSSRSGNDAHANDADIKPIYDEEPMAEVQTTTEINVFATGHQHTKQPEFNNEGEKCVFNANHDHCVTKFLNEVNSRAKVPSNKITNRNKLIEQISVAKKPKRQIPKGHRNHGFKEFSSDEHAMTYEQHGLGLKPHVETSVANDTSGLVPQRKKASGYDNSGPVPQLKNVSPSADTTVPSQQELDNLFGPLYDEFFTAGTSSVNNFSSPTDNSKQQDTTPATNIQSSTEPTNPTNGNAKENNDNQAEDTQFH